jgi:hypothetical protein
MEKTKKSNKGRAGVLLDRTVNHFRDNCCWQQCVVVGIGMAVLAPISVGASIGVLTGATICLFVFGPLLEKFLGLRVHNQPQPNRKHNEKAH